MSLRGDIKLIHGDCMEAMKDMPDNAFELAIDINIISCYNDGIFSNI